MAINTLVTYQYDQTRNRYNIMLGHSFGLVQSPTVVAVAINEQAALMCVSSIRNLLEHYPNMMLRQINQFENVTLVIGQNTDGSQVIQIVFVDGEAVFQTALPTFVYDEVTITNYRHLLNGAIAYISATAETARIPPDEITYTMNTLVRVRNTTFPNDANTREVSSIVDDIVGRY